MNYHYGEFIPEYKNGDWAEMDKYDDLAKQISNVNEVNENIEDSE